MDSWLKTGKIEIRKRKSTDNGDVECDAEPKKKKQFEIPAGMAGRIPVG